MEVTEAVIHLALIVLAIVTVFFGIVIGFPVWLSHRRKMLEMSSRMGQENRRLQDRVATLEKRCDKLDEQIVEAHMQMADEGRQLDRKLSSILPDIPAPAEGAPPERAPPPRRVRE